LKNAHARLNSIRHAKKLLNGSLEKCRICPRKCGVDRTNGILGFCRAGLNPAVYSYSAHYGEEPPLSGTKGSGTIFFTHCNMKCAYCQNYYFSQLDKGKEISASGLAESMLYLQKKLCHNINLVSPTHFVPQIVDALEIAVEKGLSIPIVYNTSGYDLPETVQILDGVIDIYMPDMRYSDNSMAKLHSDAPGYREFNRSALKEMQAQVGDLILDDNGLAKRGLIIRLLVLPENISGTIESLRFIKDSVSKNAYLSIMSQYYPTYKAYNFKGISRGVTNAEYKNVVDEAAVLGLNNGWIQEMPDDQNGRFLGTNIQPR